MTGTSGDSEAPTSIDLRWIKAGGDVIGYQQIIHLPRPTPAALHTLPPPPTTLAGRIEDLKELLAELDPTPADSRRSKETEETDQEQSVNGSGGVVVSALAGMGGVGKTALALAAGAIAHHERWFCAELFVDLRGYALGAEPLSAEAALDVLLRQTGTDPEDIPAGVQERSSFYRSALQALSEADEQGRPVLVVADNASSASQVRPLLPGAGGHRLVATSRGGLHSLVGTRHLTLDVLDLEAAIALLASDLLTHTPGDPRAEDQAGLGRLASLCGLLPLALEIAAAYLKRTPRLAPARLADRLENAASRVDKLTDPDRDAGQARALRAVFDTSLDRLNQTEAGVFLLVACTPGPTLGAAGATALTGLPLEEVEEALEELAAAHLLTQPVSGRWGAHNLLADYAAHHPHPPNGRDQALGRLLDHYTATTHAADAHLRALPGQPTPDLFPDRDTALVWLEVEHATLVAAALAAPTTAHTEAAIALPLHLAPYLGLGRHFEDLEKVSRCAQRTAHTIGDHTREAGAWNNLGTMLREMRRFEEAIDALTRAREAFHQTGDTHGEARARGNLGTVLQEVGWFEEAIDAHTRGLHYSQQVGDAAGEAASWNNLGLALREVGRFEEAIDALTRDLHHCQQVGDVHGEAQVSSNLGAVLQEVGRFGEVIDAHTRAREAFNQTGDVHGEAQACNSLGMALAQMDRFEEAINALTRARDLHQQVGHVHCEAQACNSLGMALARVDRFDEAINAHTRAREAFHQTGDTHGEAQAWDNLDTVLREVGRFEEAIDALTRARDLYQQVDDDHCEAQAWGNLGLALAQMDRFEEAINALTRARDLHQQVDDDHAAAQVWENIGLVLQETDQFDEAINAHTRARDLYQQVDDDHCEAQAWGNLGLALAQAGQFGDATEAVQRAVDLFEAAGDEDRATHTRALFALIQKEPDTDDPN